MIHSYDGLLMALAGDRLISRQPGMDALPDFRWILTDTGETVHGSIVAKAMNEERICPVSYDIAGEPYEWGINGQATS